MKNTLISYKVIYLDADEMNIYCLIAHYSSKQKVIFANQFVQKKSLRYLIIRSPFYLNDKVFQLVYRNVKFFFCLYEYQLCVINENTGVISEPIEFIGDYMAWDFEGNFIIHSISYSKIWKYNFDERALKEFSIKNAPK